MMTSCRTQCLVDIVLECRRRGRQLRTTNGGLRYFVTCHVFSSWRALRWWASRHACMV
jgi:hypothetical protein